MNKNFTALAFLPTVAILLWLNCDSSDETYSTMSTDEGSIGFDPGAPLPDQNDNTDAEDEDLPELGHFASRTETAGDKVLALDENQRFIAVIDPIELGVETIPFGLKPDVFRGLGRKNAVFLLDSDQGKLVFIDTKTKKSRTVSITPGYDSIVSSADSEWFIVYGSTATLSFPSGSQAINLQQIALVHYPEDDLENITVLKMVLYAIPLRISFDATATKALIESIDGLEVLPLEGSSERIFLPFPEGVSIGDVIFLPNADLAIARDQGKDIVYLFDLFSKSIRPISFSGTISDLALLPYQKKALVVESGKLTILDLLTTVKTPVPIGHDLRSIVTDLDHNLLIHHHLADNPNLILVQQYQENTVEEHLLPRQIKDFSISPNGDYILFIHADPGGFVQESSSRKEYNEQSLISLLDRKLGSVVPIVIATKMKSFLFNETSSYVFFLLENDRHLYYLDLKTKLVEQLVLTDPAVALGRLTNRSGLFIPLEHLLGKIAFVFYDDEVTIKELTGYRLNEPMEVNR